MKMRQIIKINQILMLQHRNTHQIPIRTQKLSFERIMIIIIFHGKMHGNLYGKMHGEIFFHMGMTVDICN